MADRGRFSSPVLNSAKYSPGNRLKTTAAILTGVQLLLSYNTCRGIQLLQWCNFSWLLHLRGNIELAGSKSRGRIIMTGEAPFHRCYKLNLTFYTCRGFFTKLWLSALIKAWPTQNFGLKKLYENENLIINNHPAEHQGQLFYPSKSFAALQNLVRLYL